MAHVRILWGARGSNAPGLPDSFGWELWLRMCTGPCLEGTVCGQVPPHSPQSSQTELKTQDTWSRLRFRPPQDTRSRPPVPASSQN